MTADKITYEDGVLNVFVNSEDTIYRISNNTLQNALTDTYILPLLFKGYDTFQEIHMRESFKISDDKQHITASLEVVNLRLAEAFNIKERTSIEIDPIDMVGIFLSADKENHTYYKITSEYKKIHYSLIEAMFKEEMKSRELIVPFEMFNPLDKNVFVEIMVNKKILLAAYCQIGFNNFFTSNIRTVELMICTITPRPVHRDLDADLRQTYWFGDEKTYFTTNQNDVVEANVYNLSNNEAFTFVVNNETSPEIRGYKNYFTRTFYIPEDPRDTEEFVESYISDKLIESINGRPVITSLSSLL